MHTPTIRSQPSDVYSVSRLNTEVRALIEAEVPPLWVEGELSNVARPRSGHLYFSLKDARCQVRCAMFRRANQRLEFAPEDGQQVLAYARPGLYAERGEFQLVVEYLEEAGAGALRRAFEALKAKLAAEGLFDVEAKRPLPDLPNCIGIISSATGAALRDILSVTRRRCPYIPVVIYPVPVQGEAAAPAIARMLDLAGARAECDVLILARGGGSLENLWAFNEETVARALRRCPIPVVAGVGHEVDFTIADFAADRRAATPSAAAELVTPDASHWVDRRRSLATRLTAVAVRRVAQQRQQLAWLVGRLAHPRRRLGDLAQRLDHLNARLASVARASVAGAGTRLSGALRRLDRQDPAARVAACGARRASLQQRLDAAAAAALAGAQGRWNALARALDAVGPRATLERGYAIVTRAGDGRVLRHARAVAHGERVDAQLAAGRLHCVVESTSGD